MAVGEFDLIRRHFTRPVRHTALGVGDDAALIDPTPGMQMVVATDMLVAGTHFFAEADPRSVGHKALAVNLSDLAAMGATPRQALLGIALPSADEAWVAAFAEGFAAVAQRFAVDWVGGDTTRGPLNVCVTVIGEVPRGEALLRSGAQVGDAVWVSGVPGLAALALAELQGRCQLPAALRADAHARLHSPEPRVALGLALRGVAGACIDVSDGLLSDLGHILDGSACGVVLDAARLPWPARATDGASDALIRQCLLSGGDDYELLFTAPQSRHADVAALAAATSTPVWCIGEIVAGSGIALLDEGQLSRLEPRGYDHFA
ncbi:MAG: thiamine-phosphate kinase [Burkholderiales bacterium]